MTIFLSVWQFFVSMTKRWQIHKSPPESVRVPERNCVVITNLQRSFIWMIMRMIVSFNSSFWQNSMKLLCILWLYRRILWSYRHSFWSFLSCDCIIAVSLQIVSYLVIVSSWFWIVVYAGVNGEKLDQIREELYKYVSEYTPALFRFHYLMVTLPEHTKDHILEDDCERKKLRWERLPEVLILMKVWYDFIHKHGNNLHL